MRRPIVFVVCLGAVFTLAPLAIDMYLPAFPSMAEALGTGIDQIEASVSVFLLGYAVSQLLLGPLSDRYGRMTMMVIGLVLFVAGSVLSGLASDVSQLFAARLLQALGGGASVVVFAIVRDRFDEKQGGQIISYIMALVVVAPLLAPIVGGYILVALGWEAIFYGLAAYGAATLLLVKLLIPETRSRDARPPTGFGEGIGRLLSAYAAVLSNARTMAHIFAGAFSFAGLFAFVAGSPFVYIVYFGVAPQHYGFLVGANAVVMIAMNLVNARLLQNVAPTTKTIAGALLIGAAGLTLVAFNGAGLGLPWIAAGVIAFVGFLALISANAVVGALADFPDDSGTASAVYGVCMFGIGALSSVIVSSIESADPTAMVAVMAGCGILASLSVLPLMIRRRRAEI